MNDDNECSINYNNINSNDDDEDGDEINDENEANAKTRIFDTARLQ